MRATPLSNDGDAETVAVADDRVGQHDERRRFARDIQFDGAIDPRRQRVVRIGHIDLGQERARARLQRVGNARHRSRKVAARHLRHADYRGGSRPLVAILMISYISVLWRGIYVYASQIVKRVAEQVKGEREVRRDELTNLPNRLAFFEELESAFSRLARFREQFSVLYLDLNDFKIVNDRRGHATGDKVLVEVGRRLRESVRQVGLVARLGGDEFAVAVANAQDAAIPTALAARIVSSLDRPFVIELEKFTPALALGLRSRLGTVTTRTSFEKRR